MLAAAGCDYEYADGIACEVHTSCPQAHYCDPDIGLCVSGLRNGAACLSDEHCLSNEHCESDICLAGARLSCDPVSCKKEDGAAICTTLDDAPRCELAECGSDFACGPDRICIDGTCANATRQGTDRVDGESCAANEECTSGACFEFTAAPDQPVCVSEGCTGDPYAACGAKAVCHKGSGLCVPRGLNGSGAACSGSLDCQGGLCVDGVCTTWCKTDDECIAPETCGGLVGIEEWGGCYVR